MIPLAEPKKEVTRYKISSVERLGKISKKKNILKFKLFIQITGRINIFLTFIQMTKNK